MSIKLGAHQTASGPPPINLNASLNTYAQITGKVSPPPDEWKTMPRDLHLILHSIIRDQLAPARIIFGYDGYKNEASLRNGFIKFIKKKIGTQGYGVPNIPNLIIANGNLLIKMNGHPWCTPLRENGLWPIFGNSSTIELMLEVI